jgi:hypothetical protein
MAFCDPVTWQAWLRGMEAVKEIDIFVPGHGPTGNHTDLKLQRAYIAALEEMVAQVRRDGGTVEDALARSLPAPFDSWIRTGSGRWEANVRSAYDRQTGKPAG